MFKGIVITFFVTLSLCGVMYLAFGRSDYTEIRRLTDSISNEQRKAQQAIGYVRDRLDAVTSTATGIADRSESITADSDEADRRVKAIGSGLSQINETVNGIEHRHKEIIRVIGQNRDLDYEFRRLLERD